jgi:D-alanine-D-alanine ligase
MKTTSQLVILSGGFGPEKEVSLASGNSLHDTLRDHYPVRLVELKDETLPDSLCPQQDVVFPAVHGTFGEDGSLQALLEGAGFAYCGSGVQSSRLCMNKALAKDKASTLGLRVPRDIRFSDPTAIDPAGVTNKLGEQLILKPTDQGSSVALHIINGQEDLSTVLQGLETGNWILEERIVGREMSVGILNGHSLGIVEIIPNGGVYDYQRKYTPGATVYKFPAILDPEIEFELKDQTDNVFSRFDCRDFARVDFIINEDGLVYFLEVNTIPGLTPTSLLPKSASCSGYNFDQLCRKLVEPAMSRFLEKTKPFENCAA